MLVQIPTEPQGGVGFPGTRITDAVMGVGKQTEVLARVVHAFNLSYFSSPLKEKKKLFKGHVPFFTPKGTS